MALAKKSLPTPGLELVFESRFSDKQAGFRRGQCINDQVFKVTFDVEQRFEENKSSIVSAYYSTRQHNVWQ